jgi:hypothetical protein
MPRVPQADNISVLPSVQPAPQARMLDAPEIRDFGSRQILSQAEALGRAGNVATGIAADMQAQANKVRLDDAQNRLMAIETDLRVKASSLRGRNALERPDGKALPDEFGAEFDKAVEEIAGTLGNEYQQANFRSMASQVGTRFRGSLAQHMVGEQRTYEVETAKSGINVAVDRAIKLAGDEPERQASLAAIDGHLAALARAQGWSPEALTDARLDARSKVHSGLIATMIGSGRSMDAKAYYEANSAEMTVQARTSILPKLQEANDAQAGDAAAAAAWSAIGPKSANDPIKQADMEEQVRKATAGNPAAQRVAIDGLRQRASAFNAQQAELKATNISGVWRQIPPGGSITPQIQQSEAWLALTDTERRQIRREVDSERQQRLSWEATNEARLAARAQRGAADAARQVSQLQAAEQLAFMQNAGDYLTLSDPDVLSRIPSRTQIEAMRGKFGFQRTKELAEKWDKLQRPEKLAEARMDQDDFKLVAIEVGLNPNDPKKTEKELDALVVLKARVEQMIGAREKQTGKPMDRDDKRKLMRDEMARTVAVDRGFFSFERQMPVIGLTPNDVRAVQIPPAERRQIEDALRARGQPVTDAEVRRLFLRGASPAGALVTE